MKLYAYCVSQQDDNGNSDQLSVQGLHPGTGVGGAVVGQLKVGQLHVTVSEFKDDVVAVTRENVLAHERVVRRALEKSTPLPFRFGTVVSENQLRSYLQSQEVSLEAKLGLVRGCVEMSVKIIWPLDLVSQTLVTEGPSPDIGEEPTVGTGAAFLMGKRRQVLGDKLLTDKAKKLASWLEERLGDTALKDVVTTNPTERLVLSAAHLVSRDRVENYRQRLRLASAERSELRFLTSGPWPPYSFVNIDLEFKTQFGVS